ncbi:unnamed protein product [Polarella glacialis]|uniref:RNase NYN domain-containing protein n=1 Tax=Polarella glacialis TaxID=89957 RepID=A0A813LNK8_POLGL|nr:unnamed protein product [Polarella glacialis]
MEWLDDERGSWLPLPDPVAQLVDGGWRANVREPTSVQLVFDPCTQELACMGWKAALRVAVAHPGASRSSGSFASSGGPASSSGRHRQDRRDRSCAEGTPCRRTNGSTRGLQCQAGLLRREVFRLRRLARQLGGETSAAFAPSAVSVTTHLTAEPLERTAVALPSSGISEPSRAMNALTHSRSGPAASRRVVLNCANIGHSFGALAEGRRQPCFDWEGVRRAVWHFRHRMPQVEIYAVMQGGRLIIEHPLEEVADLASEVHFLVAAPRAGQPDADDLVTLQTAKSLNCDFVDNDNYSDWLHRSDLEESLQSWLLENGSRLHVRYVFDGQCEFLPLCFSTELSPAVSSSDASLRILTKQKRRREASGSSGKTEGPASGIDELCLSGSSWLWFDNAEAEGEEPTGDLFLHPDGQVSWRGGPAHGKWQSRGVRSEVLIQFSGRKVPDPSHLVDHKMKAEGSGPRRHADGLCFTVLQKGGSDPLCKQLLTR